VLDGRFQLKIVDFGLAALIPPATASLLGGPAGGDTAAVLHSGVGSQPYSAPEVQTPCSLTFPPCARLTPFPRRCAAPV
jgi:hypothetical protein